MINVKDLKIRDPYVVPCKNGFVLTGTTMGRGIRAFYTEDLQTFSEPYILWEGNEALYLDGYYWAPEIHSYKGLYYMTVTVTCHDGSRSCLLLQSKQVLGSYVPILRLTPKEWMCLDATLYRDGECIFAVFCREWTEIWDGQICIVEISSDFSCLIGEPKVLFSASEANWSGEIQVEGEGTLIRGYVTDGPFLVEKDGVLKMLWSSFDQSGKYVQAVAFSESGKIWGPWKQSKTPVYTEDGGHGMLFKLNNQLMLCLHSPNTPSGAERLKLVDVTDKI